MLMPLTWELLPNIDDRGSVGGLGFRVRRLESPVPYTDLYGVLYKSIDSDCGGSAIRLGRLLHRFSLCGSYDFPTPGLGLCLRGAPHRFSLCGSYDFPSPPPHPPLTTWYDFLMVPLETRLRSCKWCYKTHRLKYLWTFFNKDKRKRRAQRAAALLFFMCVLRS